MVNCLLCETDISPLEYDEHMKSKPHMKRVFEQNIYACDVCVTGMSGIQAYESHLAGKPHGRNLLKVSVQETMVLPKNPLLAYEFKIEYVTKDEVYVGEKFSLTMVANVDLTHGYSPKMVIWDYGENCIVQTCDYSKLFGDLIIRVPIISLVIRNTMIITIPAQDLETVKTVYGKGYAFHVMLIRDVDGLISNKFFVVKYAQLDFEVRIPKPIIANHKLALKWFAKHLRGSGYKVRSAALIMGNTSNSVFRNQAAQNCNNKVMLLRQWSFNFEKEDGSFVMLDDPALVRVCEAIKREANIVDLLQMLIWIPVISDNSEKQVDIAQMLCTYKI